MILDMIDQVENLVRKEISNFEWHDLPTDAPRNVILPASVLANKTGDLAVEVVSTIFSKEGWAVRRENNILQLREDFRPRKRGNDRSPFGY